MSPPILENGAAGATSLTRVPQPATVPEWTTAAMEAFACLAEQCPDTCCRDWAVPVDRADLDRLKGAMSSTPEGRERLVRLIVIGGRPRGTDTSAQLYLDESGGCPMLEEDQRCGVHATLGEQALTTACSVFPRTALQTSRGVEVGGSLGCPEVARLTLLPETPLRVAPATKPMLPRPYIGKTIAPGDGDAYARHFLDVRETLLDCFRHPLPLGTRLALAADFATRLAEFFHAGTTEMDGARRSFAERRLQAEREVTAWPTLHEELNADLKKLVVSDGAAAGVMGLIAGFVRDRRQLPHSDRFATLVEQALPGTSQLESPGSDITSAWWATYARRRDVLQARAGRASDTVFGNYAQHFLMRNPYTDAATPLDHLQRLAMHLGAVRLLTVLHPAVEEQLGRAPDAASDAAMIQRVAVEVVQIFTKAISHHPEYLNASLNQTGPATFGRLVLLAKFV